MIEVKLFRPMGDASGLQAEALLRSLAATYPHNLSLIDVEAEAGTRVEVGGRRVAGPLTRDTLASALAVAQAIERTYAAPAASSSRRADGATRWLTRHWLAIFNSVVGVYLGLPFLAPVLMREGLTRPASWIYAAYSFVCHQFPFRSFFLFGPRLTYPRDILQAATGVDPNDLLHVRAYVGTAATGFKVALCERDIAMYAGIFLAGLAYALLRPHLKPLHWTLWVALGLVPIGLDGGTQLISQLPFGLLPFRESTALLRVVTGALFGVMSVWFAYPYVQESMDDNLRAVERSLTGPKAPAT